jgi:fibrillarin-like rRNA methylase
MWFGTRGQNEVERVKKELCRLGWKRLNALPLIESPRDVLCFATAVTAMDAISRGTAQQTASASRNRP